MLRIRRPRVGNSCALWRATLYVTLLTPLPAHAWAEAEVRTATTHLDVHPDGHASVAMVLTLRVHRGWVEGFEVSGLDSDLQLDPLKPPWVISEHTDRPVKYSPTVRTPRPGTVELGFSGRGRSPKKGTYKVGLHYRTDLARAGLTASPHDRARIEWTFPAWRFGLEALSLSISAPAQTIAAEIDETTGETSRFGSSVHGDRVLLRWKRVHLPRTTSWTVAVEIPREKLSVSVPPAPTLARRTPPTATSDRGTRGVVAGLLLLLTLLAHLSFGAAARRRRTTPRPLVPLPGWVRLALMAGLALLIERAWTGDAGVRVVALAALALLGVQRCPRAEIATARGGHWRPADASLLHHARRQWRRERWGLAMPFDLTTPIGAALVVALTLFMWWWLHPVTDDATLWAILPAGWVPFLTGTRYHLFSGPAQRLARLARAASRMRNEGGPPFAMRLVVYIPQGDDHPHFTDAQVELVFPEGAELREARILLEEGPDWGGVQRVTSLVTSSGGAWARRSADDFPDVGPPTPKALARLAAGLGLGPVPN